MKEIEDHLVFCLDLLDNSSYATRAQFIHQDCTSHRIIYLLTFWLEPSADGESACANT